MKFLLCFLFLSSFVLAEEDFPATIQVNDTPLQLTGTSLRKKFGIKVYKVAHYIQDAEGIQGERFQEILADNRIKQLTMKWLRGATVDQYKEGNRESMKRALSANEFKQLEPTIEQYLAFFTAPMNKGDVLILRWIPEGQISVILNDKEIGSLTNPAFAKALWSLWFGPKSVVNRDQLTSLMKVPA